MKNLDLKQKEKAEILQRINQAVKDGNEEGFATAFTEFTDLLQEAVMAEARGMVQAADNTVLVGRGVRALTSTETKYYESIMEAIGSDKQSAYQLQIIDTADSSICFDSGKVTSGVSSLTLPAGELLNNGQYQWKVKCWDSIDQEGPYSDLATFYTSAIPIAAITTPVNDGAIYESSVFTPIWTYLDAENEAQSYFRTVLQDALGGTLEDSGKVAGQDTSYVFNYPLVNGTDYQNTICVWDAKGIMSATVIRTFTCIYTPPTTPTFAVSEDNSRGSITLSITNPTPEGDQPELFYNSVYRKKSMESIYIRVATGIVENGTYTDYTPASGVTYDYKIRSIGENYGYADSTMHSGSITIKNSQLALTSDYSQVVALVYNATRSDNRDYGKVMMDFAGRTEPVAEFGKQIKAEIPLNFTIKDDAILQSLIDLIEKKGTLLYRDQRGRREFVTVGSLSISDQFRPKLYIVSFTPQRTSYSEVV